MRCDDASSGFLGKSLLTFVLNKGVPGAAPVPLPAHKFSPHDVVAVRPNATASSSSDATGSIAQGVAYRVHEDKIIVAVDDLDDSATLDIPLRLDKLANKVLNRPIPRSSGPAAAQRQQLCAIAELCSSGTLELRQGTGHLFEAHHRKPSTSLWHQVFPCDHGEPIARCLRGQAHLT